MSNPNFTGNPQQLAAAGAATVGAIAAAPAVALAAVSVAAAVGIGYLIKKKNDKEKGK